MSHNYDNWERLVAAVMLRMRYLELALRSNSSSSSFISTSDDDASCISSMISEFQLDVDSSSSLVHQSVKKQIPMDYSDLVLDHNTWNSMLPPGEMELLYRSACMIFFLDEDTGRNCFFLGISNLDILGWCLLLPDFAPIWELKSNTKSRFLEVAELKGPVEIHCNINILTLTPNTLYMVYLVLKLADEVQQATPQTTTSSYLLFHSTSGYDTSKSLVNFEEANDRVDGWKELAVGEVYVGLEGKGSIGGNHHIMDGQLAITVYVLTIPEVTSQVFEGKIVSINGAIVEGIEFRPLKGSNSNATKRQGIFPKPVNYSDLVLDHNAWQSLLPAGENELLYRSASMHYIGLAEHVKQAPPYTSVYGSILHHRQEYHFVKPIEFKKASNRIDGWKEIALGEVYVGLRGRVKGKKAGKHRSIGETLEIDLTIIPGHSHEVELPELEGELMSSSRVIIEGIEFRPLQEEYYSIATATKPHEFFSRFRKM